MTSSRRNSSWCASTSRSWCAPVWRAATARRGYEVSEADLGGEGQLQRVLEDFYDRTLASIGSSRERRRIRRLCEQRLISSAGRRLTEAEEEIEKKHGVSKKTLRLLVDTRLLRPEPRLGGVFYELSHDTLVGPILRSRKKRLAWTRVVGGGARPPGRQCGFVVGIYRSPDIARQQTASACVPRPGPACRRTASQLVFLELLNARLGAIEERFRDGLGSREGYTAMMFAAEDVGRRYPEVSTRAQEIQGTSLRCCNRQFGLEARGPARGRAANRRIRIARRQLSDGKPGGRGRQGRRTAAQSDAVAVPDPGA